MSKKKIAPLSPIDERRFRESSTHHALTRHVTAYQWVGTAAAYADDVVRSGGSSAAANALFWIRLFEILTALRERVEEIAKHLPADVKQRMRISAIDRVSQCLSEDELLYAEYRRHVECHLVQDGYRLQLDKEGKLIERRRRKLIGRELTHDETIAAIERVLLSGGSERNIVVNFARRTRGALQRLPSLFVAEAEAAQRIRGAARGRGR